MTLLPGGSGRYGATVTDDVPPPSLSGRLGVAAAGWVRAIRWPAALGVAALLAAGPVATLAVSEVMIASARRDISATESRDKARLATLRRDEAVRGVMGPLLARPTFGATLEAIARALPAESSLVSAERRESGLSMEVSAPDPDRLRSALRREPALGGLRDAGQRQGEGGLIVRLERAE